MKLYLYNTASAANSINKTLTDKKEFDINFKDVADISNPVIKLKSNELLDYNYAHIPELGRYYFIRANETMFPNGMFTLKLEVDLLESYKYDILKSEGTVTRGKYSNDYFDGGDYRSEVRLEHLLYRSDKEVEYEDNTILVTIGG